MMVPAKRARTETPRLLGVPEESDKSGPVRMAWRLGGELR